MKCATVLELLSVSLDGELTPAEAAQLQAHLDTCPSCRALREELSGLHAACAEMEVLPPVHLKDQILQNLPSQHPGKTHPWRRWGAMAATLAIVALAAWRLPHTFFQEPAADTSSVTAGGAMDSMFQYSAEDDTVLENGLSLPEGRSGTVYGQAESDLPTADKGEIQFTSGDEDLSKDPLLPKADQEIRTTALEKAAPAAAGSADTAVTQDTACMDHAAGGSAKTKESTQEAQPTPAPTAAYSFQASKSPDLGDSDAEAAPADMETGLVPITMSAVGDEILDDTDFSQYSAVVTLTSGNFEGGYLWQTQGNGDVWYLLPLSDWEDQRQALDEAGSSYELRQEGEDLTADASYVLLIVPAAH